MPHIGPEVIENPTIPSFCRFQRSLCTVSERFHGLEVPKQSEVKSQAIQYPF